MSAADLPAEGTSNGSGLVPPRSASRESSVRQSLGAKKSSGWSRRRRSGPRRKTASPSLQVETSIVLPVATNSERPSLAIPPEDPTAPPAGAPADDVARVLHADADYPAVIVPAIAVMTPIGDIDVSVEDGECAALVLIASVETLAARCERFGDIDRPARQGRAVLQRQGKNSVMRTRRLPDHRGDIDRLGRLVDDRRTGNAERVDIAAIQRRERHGPAQRAHPDFMARARIDRVDIVVFGGDEEL